MQNVDHSWYEVFQKADDGSTIVIGRAASMQHAAELCRLHGPSTRWTIKKLDAPIGDTPCNEDSNH